MSISCISKSLDCLHCVSLGNTQRLLDMLPAAVGVGATKLSTVPRCLFYRNWRIFHLWPCSTLALVVRYPAGGVF